MGTIKQTLIEVLRKPFYHIIIFLSVFLLVSFMAFGMMLEKIIDSYYGSFADMSGYCIAAEIDGFQSLADWNETIAEIKENEHIIAYNNGIKMEREVLPVNFKNVPYQDEGKDGISETVDIIGNIDTMHSSYFRNAEFELEKGIFPGEQNPGVLVHTQLAEENGLAVGDTIGIEWDGAQINLNIVGTYQVNHIPQEEIVLGNGTYYVNRDSSIMFCDYSTFVLLRKTEDCRIIDFYVDEYENMESCCTYIRELLEDKPDTMVVDTIENQAIQMSHTISLIDGMADTVLRLTYVMSILIMTFLLVFWVRKHGYMIYTYRVLGKSSGSIFGILFCEILIVTLPPLLLAGIAHSLLLNQNVQGIFLYIMDVCGVDFAEQHFALQNWNFEPDYMNLITQMCTFEILAMFVMVIGVLYYIRVPVRKLKNSL